MARQPTVLAAGATGPVDPAVAEELKRVQAKNEELKKQIEAMAHTQAKLAAKHARYRDERKEAIEQGLLKGGDEASRNQSVDGASMKSGGAKSTF